MSRHTMNGLKAERAIHAFGASFLAVLALFVLAPIGLEGDNVLALLSAAFGVTLSVVWAMPKVVRYIVFSARESAD